MATTPKVSLEGNQPPQEKILDNEQNGRERPDPSKPSDPSRRSFLEKAGGLTAIALASAIVPLEPLLGGKESTAEASVISYDPTARAAASFDYREDQAETENINVGELQDNGDSTTYTDFSGTFSKALEHQCLGLVQSDSWLSMKTALTSGKFSDFQAIDVGTPVAWPGGPNGHLNGPEASLAFDLEGLDSHATNAIGPAPGVATAQTADEQVEHYWAALLRDTPFLNYTTNNSLALAAANDLNNLTFIKNSAPFGEYPYPVNKVGPDGVTLVNLFRGQIKQGDGNVMGPYLSQFLVQPFMIGQLPVTQKYITLVPNVDYLTSLSAFEAVQNGGATNPPSFNSTPNYIRDGRDLASIPHNDPNYQEYYFAYLILSQIGDPSNPGAPTNPGNPYLGSLTQKPFGTFGVTDITATLAEVTSRAIKASWFHKWIVNLRLRPEEYGALVQDRKLPGSTSCSPQAAAALDSDVVNDTNVLNRIFNKYGTYLLPQAYPEGCPTHPCYPTGHGTVAGACCTVLKFFFDGSQKIQPLLQQAGSDVKQPTTDGTSLTTYTGSDAGSLTINGELVKLCFNVSFGHGIHAGIHFRSSTNASILLGEQVAISVLQDRANSYFEPFTISFTKFDGTTQTITNAGNGSV
jgi:hypothetical protein